MRYQKELETAAWIAGGKTQVAPAQRMVDFIEGRLSADLPDCSYPPGIVSHRVNELLPPDIAQRPQVVLRAFGAKRKGYLTNEAEIRGLFPCGEGAGCAGGIVSAAMDGARAS